MYAIRSYYDIIAHEMGVNIKSSSGPVIEKRADFLGMWPICWGYNSP